MGIKSFAGVSAQSFLNIDKSEGGMETEISAKFPFESKFIEINRSKMH